MPLVSDSQCREGYGQDLIADSMMCAGYENGGKDACQVDSLILLSTLLETTKHLRSYSDVVPSSSKITHRISLTAGEPFLED